jgi:hypothetical protein
MRLIVTLTLTTGAYLFYLQAKTDRGVFLDVKRGSAHSVSSTFCVHAYGAPSNYCVKSYQSNDE